MDRIILRPKAGTSQSPWLQSAVQHMQRALITAGFELEADGYFGSGTETQVKAFQLAHGLNGDSVVGPKTRKALLPFFERNNERLREIIAAELPGFRGDSNWIHLLEGHIGRPYWPGGASGITLDPGVDLGHAEREIVLSFLDILFSAEEWVLLERFLKLKGQDAKAALAANPELQEIQISREAAEQAMPLALKSFWGRIVERFPSLSQAETLATVQTVLLSLAYNRGSQNGALQILGDPLAAGDWREVARLVGGMQQNHDLVGIRKRRRWEAALIEAELAWTG